MKKLILPLLLLTSRLFAQGPPKPIDFQNFQLIERVEDEEKQYQAMLRAHSDGILPDLVTNDFRIKLAIDWLEKGNVAKYQHYKSTGLRLAFWQYHQLLKTFIKFFDEKKDYQSVERISAELLGEIKNGSLTDDFMSELMELNAAANARLGHIDRAKAMLKMASDSMPEYKRESAYEKDTKSNYINRSAIVMLCAGQYQEAFELLSTAYKKADSNPYMDATFKEVYQKLKGSDHGFNAYLKSLKDEAYQSSYKEVEKLYIASPQLPLKGIPAIMAHLGITSGFGAIAFTATKPVSEIVMQNMAGKPICLGDYKGKVLVIDFWLTTCTPCVAAFSGFEKVVADYSKDQLQLFVVNILESDQYIRSFAAHKGIKLDILLDKENLAYDVQMTPTKIVFDAQGNIRFYSSGYAGSTDREYYKLKAMVEITKNRSAAPSKAFGE